MRLIAFVILGLICIAGCGSGSGSSGLQVEVSFDSGMPSSTRDQAVRVEVYVLGSCEEVALGARPESALAGTHVLRDGGGPALGDDLDPGEYGLYALAKDADCAVVAAGCEPVRIGPDAVATLSVGLGPASGSGCPAQQECTIETGDCVMTGGGGAGGDGGTGGVAGSGGTGGTGDCALADDETPCSIAGSDGVCRMGACCSGCWDGDVCQPGNATQACGTGGEICQFTPGCEF